MASDDLAWALAAFSGYIAADGRYDEPCCVLSIVDNRRFRRLVYDVQHHHPTHEDIGRFKAALDARSLTVQGITTDGSPLYPGPSAEIFGPVPHQICAFHTVAEITKAVRKAVARGRKALAAQMTKLPRGRPASKEAKRKARAKNTLLQKVTELFDHRHLFVQHSLTKVRKTQEVLAGFAKGAGGTCSSLSTTGWHPRPRDSCRRAAPPAADLDGYGEGAGGLCAHLADLRGLGGAARGQHIRGQRGGAGCRRGTGLGPACPLSWGTTLVRMSSSDENITCWVSHGRIELNGRKSHAKTVSVTGCHTRYDVTAACVGRRHDLPGYYDGG